MKIITEIVEFNVEEHLSKDAFVEIVNDLEINFHSVQSGFIDTELLYDEKTQKWIMIQHWDSIENLKSASSKMFKNTSTEKFRNALKAQTVKMNIIPQIKSWKL
ncbi:MULTISPECIES: antibiotic biosynthesis monooxygenase [unclassified Clostridioides]|uniref:antibiotic biosynthesis monooxygenase n=1 Tax=unclassified Clostridioides TaxID=2635829 RepID=UPI001D11DAA9|nr:antibiotic biosynthesis monooxygenase [Clostridioides sp. ES-S-0049-03]MCC0657033.1 antibiotic biosynthesis monooxygenase [Clostridioides sp. ES-S-0123-01]MCC0675632.1 antibiotic biosynthesis monooxygenase [Clostridioides sp. ES-W-0018-02]MCC0680251.1 antibiotic biosynthesis monooxygenase [Clostridioides sp. ES-S-0005-03]MCC0707565.1 antibiotic biosynthesis monooxygenase [Clostridioides sp. ES-S-0190-01]MCC0709559.1 antibiotic biosynthesis monooxygenase [Clostridioides sp. ES-W-0017-02]UDN